MNKKEIPQTGEVSEKAETPNVPTFEQLCAQVAELEAKLEKLTALLVNVQVIKAFQLEG